ncbi:hypothetical protein EV651_1128 [Kribbella sp. VKM Ac-2571]|nr:hypothetical protein EV651_1128 [Kribbella sp. VKM Ac-2571]
MLVIAQVIGDLTLERGLQNPLGQLLQQPALAAQLEPTSPSPAHQLLDQLLVQAIQPRHGPRLLSVLHVRHHLGHQIYSHDRGVTPNFLQSPALALVCSSYFLGMDATFPTKEVCIKPGVVQSAWVGG